MKQYLWAVEIRRFGYPWEFFGARFSRASARELAFLMRDSKRAARVVKFVRA